MMFFHGIWLVVGLIKCFDSDGIADRSLYIGLILYVIGNMIGGR